MPVKVINTALQDNLSSFNFDNFVIHSVIFVVAEAKFLL